MLTKAAAKRRINEILASYPSWVPREEWSDADKDDFAEAVKIAYPDGIPLPRL